MLHVVTHDVLPQDVLITSFDWYIRKAGNRASFDPLPLMVVTTSTHCVYLVRFTTDFETFRILNGKEPINKHDLEAWCCAFSEYSDRVAVYSGGDDSKVRVVDLVRDKVVIRNDIVPKEVLDDGVANMYSDFEAGVTSILMLPFLTRSGNCIFLAGSYDDHVRLYTAYDHIQNSVLPRPKKLAELKIGGGVWRLKFLENYPASVTPEFSRYRVLASCMHAGAKILELKSSQSGSVWGIEVVASMEIHKSMNYASDVQPMPFYPALGWNDTRICVSTSFYDRLVSVWKFDPVKSLKTPRDENPEPKIPVVSTR